MNLPFSLPWPRSCGPVCLGLGVGDVIETLKIVTGKYDSAAAPNLLEVGTRPETTEKNTE